MLAGAILPGLTPPGPTRRADEYAKEQADDTYRQAYDEAYHEAYQQAYADEVLHARQG